MKPTKLLTHGLASGLLASSAGIAYLEVYRYLMLTDFSLVVNWGSIAGASFFGCLLMTLGYWLLFRFGKQQWIGWLNLLIAGLSFLSILGAMTTTLPLEVEFPELFPGLVVPMHFFPALTFFALFPLFLKPSER